MKLPDEIKPSPVQPARLRTINTLYFYLTEGCNLACRHCWLGPRFDPAGNRYPTLPVETFETAIREARPLGLSGVKLTGGEPLLHPQIVHLLEIVRRETLSLTIETNGLPFTPEIAAANAATMMTSSSQRLVLTTPMPRLSTTSTMTAATPACMPASTAATYGLSANSA